MQGLSLLLEGGRVGQNTTDGPYNDSYLKASRILTRNVLFDPIVSSVILPAAFVWPLTACPVTRNVYWFVNKIGFLYDRVF